MFSYHDCEKSLDPVKTPNNFSFGHKLLTYITLVVRERKKVKLYTYLID